MIYAVNVSSVGVRGKLAACNAFNPFSRMDVARDSGVSSDGMRSSRYSRVGHAAAPAKRIARRREINGMLLWKG